MRYEENAEKLRSLAGESIGETLIALLIFALFLVMLAGAVSSAEQYHHPEQRCHERLLQGYRSRAETEWYNAIKGVIQ